MIPEDKNTGFVPFDDDPWSDNNNKKKRKTLDGTSYKDHAKPLGQRPR